MQLARHVGWALAAATIAILGCSGNDSSNEPLGPAGYTPKENGVPMDEASACAALTSAISQNLTRLGCVATIPTCPSYIRSSVQNAEACLQYDQGTITGCVEFFGSYTSCGDFESRPCIFAYIKGSAPNGCPVLDAGPEAGSETGTDAAAEAATGLDATTE